jgi:hypothetical protein
MAQKTVPHKKHYLQNMFSLKDLGTFGQKLSCLEDIRNFLKKCQSGKISQKKSIAQDQKILPKSQISSH